METKKKWVRPQDVEIRQESDPCKIAGRYLPHRVVRSWDEDLLDSDTNEVITIERNEIICEAGKVDGETLQLLTFHLQAGDISAVDVCDRMLTDAHMETSYMRHILLKVSNYNSRYNIVVFATNIPQAVEIAIAYARCYIGLQGEVCVNSAANISHTILEDDDECIPLEERDILAKENQYMLTTVVQEWYTKNGRRKTKKYRYIVNANDAGTAKERIDRKIAIGLTRGVYDVYDVDDFDPEIPTDTNIYVAAVSPTNITHIVPKEYTMFYIRKDAEEHEQE